MKPYALVLSDELQKVYLDFKENKDFDQDIVRQLFHYYKGSFLTNTDQMKRIGRAMSPSMEQQLRGARFTTQSLEELAGRTIYKIILSTDNNRFPYVNIHGDPIENNLTGSFVRGVSRDKAIAHIQALCKKATKICIYDKYITKGGNERTNQEKLNSIANLWPDRSLCIVYQNGQLDDADVNFLKAKCKKWTFEKRVDIPEHHDRYLIIDDKMEIILTSGFSSLSNNLIDFTYIVRPVNENRFE